MSVKAGQAKIRKRTRLGFAKGDWQKIVTAPDVVSEAIELVRHMSCQQWQRFIYLLDQNEWLPAKGFLQGDCIIETGREQIEAVAEQRVISARPKCIFLTNWPELGRKKTVPRWRESPAKDFE